MIDRHPKFLILLVLIVPFILSACNLTVAGEPTATEPLLHHRRLLPPKQPALQLNMSMTRGCLDSPLPKRSPIAILGNLINRAKRL